MQKTVIIALALATLGLEIASGQSAIAVAPEAIGARVALVCTSCHGAQTYTQLRASRDEWRRYVYEMMLHGAQIRPAEFEPITDYLTSAYGLSSTAAGPPAAPASAQGESLVNRVCASSCHALAIVTAVRRTPDNWEDVLTRMHNHGASMTAAEREAITTYLVGNFGRR